MDLFRDWGVWIFPDFWKWDGSDLADDPGVSGNSRTAGESDQSHESGKTGNMEI